MKKTILALVLILCALPVAAQKVHSGGGTAFTGGTVALTGDSTATTPTRGDNDTSIATTEFVGEAVAGRHVYSHLFSSGTSQSAVGGVTLTSTGSAVATAGDTGNIITYTSNAVNGNAAGIDGIPTTVRPAFLPDARFAVQMAAGEVAHRTVIGLSETSSMNADAVAASYAVFRQSTVAGETNWMTWVNDGAGNGTVTNTGVAVTSNLVRLRVRWFSLTEVRFYIDDVLVDTRTTDIPGSVALQVVNRRITQEAVAKTFKYRSLYIDMPGLGSK